MTKKINGTNIGQVYELVNETRKELTQAIERLEDKFDTLEQGRLSMLEKDFANLQGKIAIISAMISVAVSILFLVINIYLRK